jgi:hypothetical protein
MTAARLATSLALVLALALVVGGALAAVLFGTPTIVSTADVQHVSQGQSIDAGGEADLAIAADGKVYVAWEDDRGDPGGGNQLYYNRSDDNGQTWSGASESTAYVSDPDSRDPSLANSGTQVYLAWTEGATVSHVAQMQLTGGPAPTYTVPSAHVYFVGPSDLAVEPGGRLHIVFAGAPSGIGESDVLYSGRSPSSGWSSAEVIYTHTGGLGAFAPRLALDAADNLHVVLQDDDIDQILYISGTNNAGAVTWGTSQAIQGSILPTVSVVLPDIAVDSDGVIHAAWAEVHTIVPEGRDYPTYARSTDGGVTWTSPQRLDSVLNRINNVTPFFLRARIATQPADGDDDVFVVWEGDRASGSAVQEKVWLAESGNGGKNWSGPRQLSQNTGTQVALRPVVAADPFTPTVHVAWSEQQANINYRTYYVRGAPGSVSVYLPIVLKKA